MPTTARNRRVIEALHPIDPDRLLLAVELVGGRFVWRAGDKVLEKRCERRAAIDRTLLEYVGHRDFFTLLSVLEPLDRWCQRHGTGKAGPKNAEADHDHSH